MNDSAYSPGNSSDGATSDSFSSESNSSFNNNESISEDNKSSDTDTGNIWKFIFTCIIIVVIWVCLFSLCDIFWRNYSAAKS